jgi:hypothetical protein
MKCLDISSNNHDGTVFNWQDAKAAGYDAVYIKATQNDNYVNPYLIADCKDARNAGFEVGIYHFYGSSNGIADPHVQAAWFLRNGIQQVTQYVTLHPVVDVEVGTPGEELQLGVEQFISALAGDILGVYENRNFESNMPGLDATFLWLAWPGWTNEPVPEHTAMVQNEQVVVAGIGENGKVTDVSEIINATAIGIKQVDTPTTIPINPREDTMVSTTQLDNGDIVTYVLLPSNEHLLEITRKKGTAGEAATGGNMSIIDITDAFSSTVPA